MVRLAKAALREVLRSRTDWLSREIVQGVGAAMDEEGKRIWVFDCEEMVVEVVVAERAGRGGASSGVSAVVDCWREDGGGAAGTGRLSCSFGGVCRYAGVPDWDVPGVLPSGDR